MGDKKQRKFRDVLNNPKLQENFVALTKLNMSDNINNFLNQTDGKVPLAFKLNDGTDCALLVSENRVKATKLGNLFNELKEYKENQMSKDKKADKKVKTEKSKDKKVIRRDPEAMAEVIHLIFEAVGKDKGCKIDEDSFVLLSGYKRRAKDWLDDTYYILSEEYGIYSIAYKDQYVFIPEAFMKKTKKVSKNILKKYL